MGLAICPGPRCPGGGAQYDFSPQAVPRKRLFLQIPSMESPGLHPRRGHQPGHVGDQQPWEVGPGSTCSWESWTTGSGRPKDGWHDHRPASRPQHLPLKETTGWGEDATLSLHLYFRSHLLFFFFFFSVYFFILMESEIERVGEGQRERIPSRSVLSVEPDVGLDPTNREITT